MFLRVTGFKSDPDKLEQSITYIRDEVLPAMAQVPGCLGGTVIVNREKSQGAASTLWESLEAMNKAEQAGMQSREGASKRTGAEIIDVDRFEITLFEIPSEPKEPPGYSRLIMAYGDPASADAANEMLREQLPVVKQQKGFRAFAAGINRATGRAFTMSSWDSPEDREASNAALEPFRERIRQSANLYGLQVDLVETVVTQIAIPTTA